MDNEDSFFEAVKNNNVRLLQQMDDQVVRSLVNLRSGIIRNNTPLYYAADKGYLPLAKYLVEHGADVHEAEHEVDQGGYGITPLHVACLEERNLPVAIYLINQGANNTPNYNGFTPLDYVNQEMFYKKELPNGGFSSFQELKDYYRTKTLKPFKKSVWNIKAKKRRYKGNKKFINENINLPPELRRKIAHYTYFGSKKVSSEIKYLRSF
jgi:hypothetical protein